MLTHIHPSRLWFTYETRPIFNDTAYPGSESGTGQGPPSAQSPFARNPAWAGLPLTPWRLAPHQRVLPLLHRSYWLMRQTKSLPPISVVPNTTGLCRLSPVPAGSWPFPTLSLQSLRRCLDPYPAVFSWCSWSLLPRRQRPHLIRHKFGILNYPCNATSTEKPISGLQPFANVQAPTLDRPPGCTHR
jgi:hypothetical protein